MTTEIIPDNELATIIDGGGLSADEAKAAIRHAFGPIVAAARDLIHEAEGISVTAADQLTEMAEARRVRLALVKTRTNADRTKGDMKRDALTTCKVLDACYRYIADRTSPVEARLMEAELFAERAEQARKAAVRDERAALLRPFGVDTGLYNLGDMKPEAFDSLLTGTRLAHEARIEADRKAEAERIAADKAAAAERKAQTEKAAAQLAETRKKLKEAEAERAAAEEVARKERLRLQALADVERQKREAVEKVERDRLAAEAKQKAADAKAAKKAAAAPDREKLLALANQFEAVPMPTETTPAMHAALRVIRSARTTFVMLIKDQAEQIGGGE
jgi:hypothetical protein